MWNNSVMSTLNKKNLTLIALGMAYPDKLSPVQLQKTVFLFQQCLEEGGWTSIIDKFYQFQPYDYGPFCQDIYEDTHDLSKQGLATIERSPNSQFLLYGASETGRSKSQQLESHLMPPVKEYFNNLSAWVRHQTFSSLLSSIYEKYPSMAVNSIFRT